MKQLITPSNTAKALGKFIHIGRDRFLVRGVTYGTFAPDDSGYQFPPADRVAEDFEMMATVGINTVRTYTVPSAALMDRAVSTPLRQPDSAFTVAPQAGDERGRAIVTDGL